MTDRRPYSPPRVRSMMLLLNLGAGLMAAGGQTMSPGRRYLAVVNAVIDDQPMLRVVYDEEPCLFIPMP